MGEEGAGGGSGEGCPRCPGARLGCRKRNTGTGGKLSSENTRSPWASTWGGWVMDVGHRRVPATCQTRESAWQRCWEAWEGARGAHREEGESGQTSTTE